MAALRRNPPRQNRPPRWADSPVSFAVMGPLAASQDLSDSSDIEILEGPPVVSSAPVVEDLRADAPPAHPLSLRVLQDHFRYSSTDSSTDSDEPSTEAPSRPREFPLLSPLLLPRNGPDPSVASLMSQVDAPGLTIQERAALLIAEIHCLQGTVQHITDRQPSPTAMPEASLPPGLGLGLFCQRLTLVPPDRNTLSRLTEAGFPLGRALGTLQNHHEYLIGTADIPVEISGDYMAIRNNFQELGSWHGLETAPESFSIRPEHVADAAQINPVSFNGMRTKFSKVRQARRLLQGYQYQNQTADAGGERDAQHDKFQFLISVLEKMLAETVLPHGAVGLVESHIVSMSISPFMTDIEEVISALN
ncbi:hypothetical protein C8J57DRAFT_1512188 [Mycena rebaudengoi]|nr:hypothetical protein C8J57DRAFT_1512188 [Mycena rebaudengoi]